MKIGLFFGTFNPVHVGHMVIANYMAEFTDLDQIWFVVSPHNPFKNKKSLLHEHHRLAMVREAIGNDIRLKGSSIEFDLPQPSYTATTLAYIKEQYPEDDFVLIMGSDNLDSFHKWKNYEAILANHELYVYPRPEKSAGELATHPKVKMTSTPLMDIASSFIRKAIKEGKNVNHMMPESVAKYIEEMHFYK